MKSLFNILFLSLPFLLMGQYERPGSTSAQFLKIGVSPRGAAMGDAYISVVDGAEAVYYNSAAIAGLKGTDIVFNHNEWFAGLNHEFAAIGHNFGSLGTIALSVTAFYTDEMDVRTPLQPDGTGETFYAGNYRYGLTYSRFLTDKVMFGGTVNYIHSSLYSAFNANAVAIDIGVLYATNFRNFRFGMQISNFGSEMKYINESYPLPTNFTFGASLNAIEFESNNLLFSFSAVKPNDGKPLASIGTEVNLMKFLVFRGGYRLNHEISTFSFGAGLNADLIGYKFHFDYAYTDFSLLGVSHRFGVGLSFN